MLILCINRVRASVRWKTIQNEIDKLFLKTPIRFVRVQAVEGMSWLDNSALMSPLVRRLFFFRKKIVSVYLTLFNVQNRPDRKVRDV